MKKYLGYIELASVILMLIGCLAYRLTHYNWAVWVCITGLALFFLQVIYKAFNWKVYAKDNSRNIIWMLVTIVMLFLIMLMKR
jgi:uncharacterized membrane protein